MTVRLIHGDCREILPTLDLAGAVVITDPPWTSGAATGIVGAGAEARSLWSDVAALLGQARAVTAESAALAKGRRRKATIAGYADTSAHAADLFIEGLRRTVIDKGLVWKGAA